MRHHNRLPIFFVAIIAITSFIKIPTAFSQCAGDYVPSGQPPIIEALKAKYAFSESAYLVGMNLDCGVDLLIQINRPDGAQDALSITTDDYGTFELEYPLDGVAGDYGVDVSTADGATLLDQTSFSAAHATLLTDRKDYLPGDLVIFTGAGWNPSEIVDLLIVETPLIHDPEGLNLTSDEDGNIYNDGYVLQPHDLGQQFTVTANGESSGLIAEATFTDSGDEEECEHDSDCNDGKGCTIDKCDDEECKHTLAGAGTTCRAAAGVCDQAETCNGISETCPSDTKKPSGTACTPDSSACTLDQCNGTSNSCQHPVAPSGTVCRAAADECDLQETCNGSSTSCPSDSKKTNGTACTPDSNACTLDQCNGSSVACQHPAGNAGAVCRAAADECDLQETCTGSSTSCPSDSKKANHTACSSDSNDCTIDECNGTSVACQHPNKSAGSTCGSSNNTDCDNPDTCNGYGTCQSNNEPNGTACTTDNNECTRDACNGGACMHPNEPAGTTCGSPLNTDCDNPDSCNGYGTCSPNYEPNTTVCHPSAGDCDVVENCDGAGSCPPDGFLDNTNVCRPEANGGCDIAESCTGSGPTCPTDSFKPSSEICRPDAGECDVAENCTGSSAACPSDGFESPGFPCGESEPSDPECDAADSCDGNGTCDPHHVAAETPCSNDHNPCTINECDGDGDCGIPTDSSCETDACSEVTNSALCPISNDTFKILYIQDPTTTNSNNYRLNATNPGQFYYNVFYDGVAPGDPVNLSIVIPYPFVTNGATPAHVYDGAGLNQYQCLVPESAVEGCTIHTEDVASANVVSPSGNEIIVLGSYNPQSIPEYTTVTVECEEMPPSGVLYVNLHLDYGLKKTTGWNKVDAPMGIDPDSAMDDAFHPATAPFLDPVYVLNPQDYDFSAEGDEADDICGDTVSSTNTFKNNPGCSGITLKGLSGDPVAGVRVQLISPAGKLLKSATTDADGVFLISYKASNKTTQNYIVKLPDYKLQQTVPLKVGGYAVVVFDNLP